MHSKKEQPPTNHVFKSLEKKEEQKITIILSDIDGTLTSAKGTKILDDKTFRHNIEAFKKITQQNNIYSALLTGRSYPAIKDALIACDYKNFSFLGVCDSAILLNTNLKIVESITFNKEDCHNLEDFFIINRDVIERSILDYWPINKTFHRFFFGTELFNCDNPQSFKDVLDDYFDNECLIIKDDEVYFDINKFKKTLFNDIKNSQVSNIMVRTKENINTGSIYSIHNHGLRHTLRPKNHNKGRGVENIIKHYLQKFPNRKIDAYYFGDAENDSPVFNLETKDLGNNVRLMCYAVGNKIKEGHNLKGKLENPNNIAEFLETLKNQKL